MGAGRLHHERVDGALGAPMLVAHDVAGGDHAEAQQQVLHGPHQGLGPGHERDPPLASGPHLAVGLQQALEEAQDLLSGQAGDGRRQRDRAVVGVEEAVAAQEGEAVEVHGPAPLDRFVAPLLFGAPQATVTQVVGQEQDLGAEQRLVAEVRQAGGHGDAGAGGQVGQRSPAVVGEEGMGGGGAQHPAQAGA